MGGRFTSPAESRYSTIEGEALAMMEALQKFKYFVLGCPEFIFATDHKPLLGVVNGSLSDIKTLDCWQKLKKRVGLNSK